MHPPTHLEMQVFQFPSQELKATRVRKGTPTELAIPFGQIPILLELHLEKWEVGVK